MTLVQQRIGVAATSHLLPTHTSHMLLTHKLSHTHAHFAHTHTHCIRKLTSSCSILHCTRAAPSGDAPSPKASQGFNRDSLLSSQRLHRRQFEGAWSCPRPLPSHVCALACSVRRTPGLRMGWVPEPTPKCRRLRCICISSEHHRACQCVE